MNKTNETNNKQETKLLRVEIADASGHQTLMLSPEETQELVEQQDGEGLVSHSFGEQTFAILVMW